MGVGIRPGAQPAPARDLGRGRARDSAAAKRPEQPEAHGPESGVSLPTLLLIGNGGSGLFAVVALRLPEKARHSAAPWRCTRRWCTSRLRLFVTRLNC